MKNWTQMQQNKFNAPVYLTDDSRNVEIEIVCVRKALLTLKCTILH